MVKNLPASPGDIRDMGLIPGSGRSLEEGMATPFHILAWRIPAGQRPSERLLLQVWGCTYYTLLPPSPPNPKLNHGESRRTSQLRRKMPKKLDHVQFRSKHTPRLVGTGGRQHSSQEALEESRRDTHSPGDSSRLISCL